MRLADDDLIYLPAGTIAAIVLGIALIPLSGLLLHDRSRTRAPEE